MTTPNATAGPSTNLTHQRSRSLNTDETVTFSTFFARQAELQAEAREVMPFSIDVCSWSQGHVKQSVWACKDCGGKGVCYGCSISCHAEHELVELFQRRKFRCDCPTDCRPYDTVLAPTPTSTSSSVPTPSPPSAPCTLFKPTITSEYRSQPLPHTIFNNINKYDRCFKGEFCRCGKSYDPETERESMIGCLGCEDWFHESCLNLQDPAKYTSTATPPDPSTSSPITTAPSTVTSIPTGTSTLPLSLSSTTSTPAPPPDVPITNEATINPTAPTNDDEEEEDNESESPLLHPRDYDNFVCSSCVQKYDVLRNGAGTKGWMMIVPASSPSEGAGAGAGADGEKEWKDGWRVIGKPDPVVAVAKSGPGLINKNEDPIAPQNIDESDPATGQKRKATQEPLSPSTESKKPRLDTQSAGSANPGLAICTAPTPDPQAQAILSSLPSTDKGIHAVRGARGDLFLADGVRESICVCPKCEDGVKALPFPLEEEEVWEPPVDVLPGDLEGTVEEMATKMLDALPRTQAIEAAFKLNAMKAQFQGFLKQFHGQDKVITVKDVEGFVQGMREGS